MVSGQHECAPSTVRESRLQKTVIWVAPIMLAAFQKNFLFMPPLFEEYQQAEGFGWGTVAPEFNWSKLLDNKNTEIVV